MSENLDETQKTELGETSGEETQAVPVLEQQAVDSKPRWGRYLLLGWIGLILISLLGGYSGFQQGSNLRQATQTAQLLGDIDRQFQLGLEELVAKNCDLARQRFEWVLLQNPEYPGAIDALAESIACMNSTATPTPVQPTSTPSASPTPDNRSIEERFIVAQAAMENKDWEEAINALFSLRKEDSSYRAVEVDSMLYVAYRNRGVDKILNQAELEGGLYDLSQAELFGPVDSEANNYRNWARFFLIGESFYSVNDWGQAAFYLGQVAPFAPNLRNGSSGFAIDWYLESLENYIENLREQKDWCNLVVQIEVFSQYRPDYPLINRLGDFRENCEDQKNNSP